MKKRVSYKKYKIIYADPPWLYCKWAGGKKAPHTHYNCMTNQDIINLPIGNIVDVDCVLFLWTTYPLWGDSMRVINGWGFEYKTVAFTWVKTTKNNKYHFGLGGWTRANPEVCTLSTIGQPRRIRKDIPNLIIDRLRKHSEKPDIVRDKIVELMGDLPRIELFARKKAEGWDATGLELDGVDIRDFLNYEVDDKVVVWR